MNCERKKVFLCVCICLTTQESNCLLSALHLSQTITDLGFRFHFTFFPSFFFTGRVRKPVKKLWRDYCHVFAYRPGLLSRSERNLRWFGQLAKYHLSCNSSSQQNGSLSPSKSNTQCLKITQKCHIWIFEFWHFPPIFVVLKLTCLVTLFDRKLLVFKNSPKWTIFCIFN